MNWKITILLVLLVVFFIACSVEAKTKSPKTTAHHTKSLKKAHITKSPKKVHHTKSPKKIKKTKSPKHKTTSKKTSPSPSNAPRTMCDLYASKNQMTQEMLMRTIITDVIARVVNPNQILAQYFNGTTPPGSRNFLDPKNRDLTEDLINRLIAFFGQLLQCTSKDFPAFHKTGNFRRIHHRMRLTVNEFNLFNAAVLAALKDSKFSTSDIGDVGVVLNSFSSEIVFQKRVPKPSVTGFPPIPSLAKPSKSHVVKTTAKKTTVKKTTAKKTKSHKKTTAKKTHKKTTAKKTKTHKKTAAKKTKTHKKTTAKKTTAKKTKTHKK